MALVMGVDSSTQSCKVVVTDAATGVIVRQGRASHPDGTSVDPEAWWTALQEAIEDAGGLDASAGLSDRVGAPVLSEAAGGGRVDTPVLSEVAGGDRVGAPVLSKAAGGDRIDAPVLSEAAGGDRVGAPVLSEDAGGDRVGAPVLSEDAGGDRVEAWAIGGQQHGMVVLDADGRVIRDALLWNDTRSADAASALIDEFGADSLAQRTGLVPVASFTITKLRWLRDHEPDNAARVAAVALPHDWLTWRLRGFGPAGESPRGPVLDELVTDRSDASGTGYWDPATGGYDHELLFAALGRDAVLPRVLGPDEWVTDAAGRRVGGGAGDNAGAALGLGADPGDVVVSIGTSGTVFAVSEERTIDPSGTVAGFADCTGRFLPLVATLNAARVLDAIARLLGVDHDELSSLALAAEPGAGGLSLIPYFEGERTPNLPDATASLTGMTLASTTRENLARAAVEGMLSGLAAGLDALRGLGVPLERAKLIGGGAQSEAVRVIAPLVLGIPVEVPEPGEYVALGAARQAARVLTG